MAFLALILNYSNSSLLYCMIPKIPISTIIAKTLRAKMLFHKFYCIKFEGSDQTLLRYSSVVGIYLVSCSPVYQSQPAITCSKLTIETLEQGVKYVQS